MPDVNWNTNEYSEGRQGFDVLPKGKYNARIDSIEKTDTKAGDGYYYAVTTVIEDGEYKGRKLWVNLNVFNKSDMAQKIGREQFNALCTACGFSVGEVRKTEQLHNKRVQLLVDVEKREGFDPRNKISGFLSSAAMQGTRTGRTSSAAEPKAQTATAGDAADDDIPF